MNVFSPSEFALNYAGAGAKKSEAPAGKLFPLAILAGMFIAFGGATANTAVHSISNVSAARIISGLLFPFGLVMVIMTGAELFTGNCLITISVLSKKTTLSKMLRNLVIVYIGNFAGSVLVAAGCAYAGQLNYSSGALAVLTIKIAAAKCTLPFGNAVVLGIFCNILVCVAVMLALCAKDAAGRAIGAYIPISIFVICGFEHCVANMYFIPAGLFALQIPKYAALAASAGIDVSVLTWGNFFAVNLLPVTLGNVIGGAAFAASMWFCHQKAQ